MSGTHPHSRPLLGLRSRPGRVALAAMRLPRPLYRHGLGRVLGHTFLLVTHRGRKTGVPHQTVAMAVTWNPATKEVVVCSVWGETQWIRNLRAHPALRVEIGGEAFTPDQRFLGADDAVAAVLAFGRLHPWRLRILSGILGWSDFASEPGIRTLVAARPFVAFRPALEHEGDEAGRRRKSTGQCELTGV